VPEVGRVAAQVAGVQAELGRARVSCADRGASRQSAGPGSKSADRTGEHHLDQDRWPAKTPGTPPCGPSVGVGSAGRRDRLQLQRRAGGSPRRRFPNPARLVAEQFVDAAPRCRRSRDWRVVSRRLRRAQRLIAARSSRSRSWECERGLGRVHRTGNVLQTAPRRGERRADGRASRRWEDRVVQRASELAPGQQHCVRCGGLGTQPREGAGQLVQQPRQLSRFATKRRDPGLDGVLLARTSGQREARWKKEA